MSQEAANLDNAEPITENEVKVLIREGISCSLVLEHRIFEGKKSKRPGKRTEKDDKDKIVIINQYYLYAKIRNQLRPIHTQRKEHRNFANLERAFAWGKNIGFKRVSLSLELNSYVLA
ncbi:hypothetical protein [Algicola sagamiensis]|uniref:hypothetical protein n=1 Tax=Algicola sagamiensis TaxID=163869 RepID=UPI00035FB6D3|nr:hypothetical protein [Algicola sagamiensis]